MIALSNLIPTNLQDEKERFFTDQTYNPQFQYDEIIDPTRLQKYGLPKPHYLQLAQKILNIAYAHSTEEELFASEGPEVTQDEVTKKVQEFLKMHGLEKRFRILWSSTFVSRTTISVDTVKLRLPADFRREGLLGMLYHEIGTHALRRVNYEQQPWFKKKKKYGFSDYLRTEEGLASLHSLIPHTNKLAFVAAIRYAAVDFAQKHSFAETWEFLTPYINDLERRWTITLREKRGLTDTSKAGGYSKDLVYFEGLVDTWKYLNQHNYDITTLYFGKMSSDDVSKAREMNPHFQPLLPSFFVTDPQRYREELELIGQENFLL